MSEMQGRRLPDGFHLEDSQPGDYWKQVYGDPNGERGKDWHWIILDPQGHLGALGTHTVEEHEDGTITVTPSILDPHNYTADEMGVLAIAGPGWHGWLTRGIWTSE